MINFKKLVPGRIYYVTMYGQIDYFKYVSNFCKTYIFDWYKSNKKVYIPHIFMKADCDEKFFFATFDSAKSYLMKQRKLQLKKLQQNVKDHRKSMQSLKNMKNPFEKGTK